MYVYMNPVFPLRDIGLNDFSLRVGIGFEGTQFSDTKMKSIYRKVKLDNSNQFYGLTP